MTMKAQPVRGQVANTCSPLDSPSPSEEAIGLEPEDRLIMVLFPKSSWDEVMRLAKDLNVPHQDVLGAALALLRARTDEELKGR